FKKVFFLNSHKHFCINYFVTEDNLEIPDRNVFTATELISVIPTYNYQLYSRFMNDNQWVKNFFPNTRQKNAEHCVKKRYGFWKKILEKLTNGKVGEQLDIFFFKITLKHWEKK